MKILILITGSIIMVGGLIGSLFDERAAPIAVGGLSIVLLYTWLP